MKVAMFSDLHVYPHFGMKQFEDIAIGFLIHLMDYCKKNKIEKVYFLGDFFHIKNKLHVLPFVKSVDILRDFKKNGIDLTFLIGNHDCPQMDTTDFSIMHAFKEYGRVIPYYEWEDIGNTRLHFLSYTQDLPKFEITQKEKNVLFGHLEINSFAMDGNFICNEGMNLNSFSMFDRVFSGHFHKHQIKENIIYVGSPYQTRFSERFDDKGFIVLDTDTTMWKFVKYEEAPKFKEITLDEIDQHDISEIQGNFVRLRTNKDNLELPKIKEKLLAAGVESVDFIFEDTKKDSRELNVVENLSLGSIKELASSYWDNIKDSDMFDGSIKEMLESKEISKDDFMFAFNNIEEGFLTNWKPEEE